MSDENKDQPVWIVEDHSRLRESLRELIAEVAGTVTTFASCEEALEETAAGPPAVIILDIGLQGMSGLEGIRCFKDRFPEVEIVMFTVHDEPERIFEAVCAGASGYLLKSEPLERIATAVGEVLRGGSPMTSEIARLMLDRFNRLGATSTTTELSDRERDVLKAMVDGLAKKEIADRLDLSIHTVDTYTRRIYRKLHVNTLGGAVARALREGLV
ncbi:MAG: response regulator transcription factor [Verrucomicrobiales bacterium]|nr:response regulator transcription factor [Verrucomicrobiales bacterium]